MSNLPRVNEQLRFMVLISCTVHLQTSIIDPDLFARLAVGKYIIENWSVPVQDVFAFTPTKTLWIDHEWLSGVIFYLTWILGGDWLLLVFKALAWTGTLLLLVRGHIQQPPVKKIHPVLLALVTVQIAHVWLSTVRSQYITYLGLALCLWVWSKENVAQRWPWLVLPLFMVFWVNSHGGFVVGLGLFGILVITLSLQGINFFSIPLFSFASCVIATICTPYNPIDFWTYILEAVFMDRPAIDEWGPVSFFEGFAIIPLYIASILILGITQIGIRGRITALALLVTSFCAGFGSARLMAIPCMIAVTFGKPWWDAGVEVFRTRFGSFYLSVHKAFYTVLSGALTAGFLYLVSTLLSAGPFGLDYRAYPVDALSWLQTNRRSGAILVDFNAGSYALWKLYPRFLVSLDGRYEEVYPHTTVNLVARAFDSEDDQQLEAISRLNPHFLLFRPYQLPPAPLPKDWINLYQDKNFVLFERIRKE
jgi:hypothetical protein